MKRRCALVIPWIDLYSVIDRVIMTEKLTELPGIVAHTLCLTPLMEVEVVVLGILV